jgi:pectin methylesterase-like acyl-CoA thioesterase
MREFVVSADGAGDFSTVQAAVDTACAGRDAAAIRVARGRYREVVKIPRDAPPIVLVGATGDARDVVITFDNASRTRRSDGSTLGTTGSATMTVSADRFSARDLTIENAYVRDPDPAIRDQQAVALKTEADRIELRRVRLIGRQDTLYLSAPSGRTARVYLRDCHIAGDVDFIFGAATAVLDRCVIRALARAPAGGYVTAASTPDVLPFGFLIVGCRIESEAEAKTTYLGRPWHPAGDPHAIAQVVVRETWLAAAIREDPWTDMHGFAWRDARLFEHRNTGPGAATRGSASRPQLSDDEAVAFTARTYLAGEDGWDPVG